ncbi:MAG: hypothetical protein KDB79_08960 [Acidobacteria bacterium]|nr:hypothetical protein [Acidobacteriota bacterium]
MTNIGPIRTIISRAANNLPVFLFRHMLLLLILFAFAFSSSAHAQKTEEPLPEGIVPPPLSILTKDEKTALDEEKKLSDRTKLALSFMDSYIERSEELTKKGEFQEALDQLGSFNAVMRNNLNHLNRFESNKGALKSFKRFEMTLRTFLPRLELIRRAVPFKFGYHVIKLIKNVRNARSESIEPLFGDTVIPEGN